MPGHHMRRPGWTASLGPYRPGAAKRRVRFRGFLPAQLPGQLAGGCRADRECRGALMVVLNEATPPARVPPGLDVGPDPPARIHLRERLDAGVGENCRRHLRLPPIERSAAATRRS